MITINLFGITKNKIDTNMKFDSVNDYSSKHRTNIELNISSEGGDYVDFKLRDKNNDANIIHTFNEEQLKELVVELEKVERALVDNMDTNAVLNKQIERLCFSIFENYTNFHSSGFSSIPRPKISIYLGENDTLYLSAIDIVNNKILFNHKVSISFLIPIGVIKPAIYTKNDMIDHIVNSIVTELAVYIKDIKCIYKEDYKDLLYLGQDKIAQIKGNGIDHILKNYIESNISIEDRVIKFIMDYFKK